MANLILSQQRALSSALLLGAWMAAGQNTTLFEGTVSIDCMNGTCTFNENCVDLDSVPGTLVRNNSEIEYTDILGDFELTPTSCQAKCSDCMAIPGSDKDEGGCIGSAGYVYCPETDQCIRPWETKCPVEGSSFIGPIDIECQSGSRCTTLSDECELSVGSFTIGGLYLTGLEGNYTIPDNCVVTCDGCDCEGCPPEGNYDATNTTDEESAGQDMILFEGNISIDCMNGTCTFNEDCLNLDSVPGTLVPTSSEIEYTNIAGEFDLTPTACQAKCSDCMAIPGSDTDEGGCIGSAGYVYCPETDECIRPWESKCPFEGASSFIGPVDINCVSGSRCSTVSDDCELSVGSYTIGGLYLTGLEGNYTVPDKCVVTCDGCDCEGCPPEGNYLNATNNSTNTTDQGEGSGTTRHTIRFVLSAFMAYGTLVLL